MPANASRTASKTKSVKKNTRVSVYHVAEQAGVSPGTVSRVMNNRGRTNENTRERVLKAAHKLGFRPQVQVRARQVAVLSDVMWHSQHNGAYYQAVWAHIALALNKHDIAMIIPNEAAELRNKYLDGIIVVGEYPDATPIIDELRQNIPVVFTDDFSASPGSYVIHCDHKAGAVLAAQHFIQTGRKKLGYLGTSGSQDALTLQGYRETIEQSDLPLHEDLLVRCYREEVTFYSAVSRIMRLGADAIYVPGSSYEALEALNVIANVLRLKIPEDVALIGGEIHGVSEFLVPPMTTIEHPLVATAHKAVETLAALMDKEEPTLPEALPVRLLRRESA